MDAYSRLSELTALLMSEGFPEGISIKGISSVLNVPPEIVAGDIITLTGDSHIKGSLVLSEDMDIRDWRRSLEKGETQALEVHIRIDNDLFLTEGAEDAVAVNLSPFEKNVFARAANASRISDAVWIKEPVFAGTGETPGTLGPLQIAIEQGHPVSFTYIAGNEREKNAEFIPRSIYLDLYDKSRYLVGKCEGSGLLLKRLDRIKELMVHDDKNVPPQREGELDLLDYIWGADIEPGEKYDGQAGESPDLVEGYLVRHVKIKIYKETANIYEKIKTETNGRRFGKLYDDPEEDKAAYYEDDVCGMGSFKRWLLGYGASVMVLEPCDLAEDIYGILQRRLDRYESVSEGPSP